MLERGGGNVGSPWRRLICEDAGILERGNVSRAGTCRGTGETRRTGPGKGGGRKLKGFGDWIGELGRGTGKVEGFWWKFGLKGFDWRFTGELSEEHARDLRDP